MTGFKTLPSGSRLVLLLEYLKTNHLFVVSREKRYVLFIIEWYQTHKANWNNGSLYFLENTIENWDCKTSRNNIFPYTHTLKNENKKFSVRFIYTGCFFFKLSVVGFWIKSACFQLFFTLKKGMKFFWDGAFDGWIGLIPEKKLSVEKWIRWTCYTFQYFTYWLQIFYQKKSVAFN